MAMATHIQAAACPHCGNDVLGNREPARPRQLVACRNCRNACLIEWVGPLPAVHAFERSNLAQLAAPGSVMDGVMGTLDDAIAALPAFPEIPQRVISMAHDPLASIAEIAKVIQEDPAFSVKVLRMANSAYFAPVQPIRDLDNACSRLGLRVLINLSYAVANGAVYRLSRPAARKAAEALWEHAIASAYAAQLIAEKTKAAEPQAAFLAGLVHDAGKLLLIDMILCRYTGPTGVLAESPERLHHVLRQFGGLVGLHVVEKWSLPPQMAFACYFADRFDEMPPSPLAREIACTTLASDLAEALEQRTADFAPLAAHPAAAALGLDAPALESLMHDLDRVLESANPVLSLG
jgi:HD-like signal output (HDOD) protein